MSKYSDGVEIRIWSTPAMSKYSDGVEIRIGDRVSFTTSDISSASGSVVQINSLDATVIVRLDPPGRGWTHTDGTQCWFVSFHRLKRLDKVESGRGVPITQLKKKPEDIYAVGPEGETAGYIARQGGLKFL